jgi:hypothetical protein
VTPRFYLVWYRPDGGRPWVPVRKAATRADAVAWVGVDHPGGDWAVHPDRIPGPGPGDVRPHRYQLPADVSRLRDPSPPPTPDDYRRARSAPNRTAGARPTPHRAPPPPADDWPGEFGLAF